MSWLAHQLERLDLNHVEIQVLRRKEILTLRYLHNAVELLSCKKGIRVYSRNFFIWSKFDTVRHWLSQLTFLLMKSLIDMVNTDQHNMIYIWKCFNEVNPLLFRNHSHLREKCHGSSHFLKNVIELKSVLDCKCLGRRLPENKFYSSLPG